MISCTTPVKPLHKLWRWRVFDVIINLVFTQRKNTTANTIVTLSDALDATFVFFVWTILMGLSSNFMTLVFLHVLDYWSCKGRWRYHHRKPCDAITLFIYSTDYTSIEPSPNNCQFWPHHITYSEKCINHRVQGITIKTIVAIWYKKWIKKSSQIFALFVHIHLLGVPKRITKHRGQLSRVPK